MSGTKFTISGVLKLTLAAIFLVAFIAIMLPTVAFESDKRYHRTELERYAQLAIEQVDELRPLNFERREYEKEIDDLRGKLAGLSVSVSGTDQATQNNSPKIQSDIERLTAKHQEVKNRIAVKSDQLRAALQGSKPHFVFVHCAQPPRVNAVYMFIAFAVFMTAWQLNNVLFQDRVEGQIRINSSTKSACADR